MRAHAGFQSVSLVGGGGIMSAPGGGGGAGCATGDIAAKVAILVEHMRANTIVFAFVVQTNHDSL